MPQPSPWGPARLWCCPSCSAACAQVLRTSSARGASGSSPLRWCGWAPTSPSSASPGWAAPRRSSSSSSTTAWPRAARWPCPAAPRGSGCAASRRPSPPSPVSPAAPGGTAWCAAPSSGRAVSAPEPRGAAAGPSRGGRALTRPRPADPPDPPGNLSCAIAEGSERLRCGWEPGRLTHLPTRHSLHLRRVVAQDEEDEEEKTFPADSPVLLSELHNDSHYSVWVQASNALGTARSAPRHLSLQELVVPALPVAIGAETTDASPARTTTRWRSQTRLSSVHCEERHRATGTPTWSVEQCDSVAQEGPRCQHELQSDTEFVFQARCRLGTARSPWSAWSPPFVYRTPEAAPAAAPAVWRRLGRALPDGSREVTVLIKPLAARDARGRILGYAVSAESPAGARLLCLTPGTECAVLVPPGARSLLVTARNAKGASRPASIPLNRAAAQEEFPAPEAVEVEAEQQGRVLVRWQPPRARQSPLLWFILEWVSSSQHGQQEQYGWDRVPQHQTDTYIPGAAVPPRVWLYAVYPGGISAPCSSPAPAEEPLLGSAYSEMSQDDDIRVFLGLSLSVVGLSILFAVVMFKKSVRKRVKATLVSLLPRWMLEDFPHLENSTVVKSLQVRAELSPGLACPQVEAWLHRLMELFRSENPSETIESNRPQHCQHCPVSPSATSTGILNPSREGQPIPQRNFPKSPA
ncbi:interleukin-12 receptor subunit beta-2-like isoform X4 [Motacilla alba alba]|uniref:interleukin-12 receptor subunit beta-2-like isoform X4 n=1 Tax=Motacilla alba alba TaxID=1094192 RepID=UPI0018D51E04|nr:interleukin-12 receptor subunit beta-2-like isoform X4 [Motacilla alba alba]